MTDRNPGVEKQETFRNRIRSPIFIVSSPRSGSTLLFETLAKAPHLFTIGGESHRVIEIIAELSPRSRGWDSNRLTAADATESVAEKLAENFYRELRDRNGQPAEREVRMLEKTPKNALRVPFFDEIWPDAVFIYLFRDARQTLASMFEAWSSGRFRTYPRLPAWTGPPWSLLLVPGWGQLNGRTLPQIVATQWSVTTSTVLDDLEEIDHERIRALDYGSLVRAPQQQMANLACSLGLGWDQELPATLPRSRFTVSEPAPEKWRKWEDEIAEVWPIVEATEARARAFMARFQVLK